MKKNLSGFSQTKKKYLTFIKSQETLGNFFKNKSDQLSNFYLPISETIHKNYLRKKKTTIIGLAGSQGSGKSTISRILKIILEEKFNLNTVYFSIDDFYKTLKMRKLMSKKVNKLFLTRGVPGTHDTKILYKCLKNLKKSTFKKVVIPQFDKSKDDRYPKKKWLKVNKKPDIVIFEGWCVGAKPQKKKDLSRPINELERHVDKDLAWRSEVNKQLKNNYKKIFNLIDEFIFLKVPNFKYVFKWRLLQERKLKSSSTGKKTMNDKQIKKFIMYYERITKNMLKTFTTKAKLVITIDKQHQLKSIKFN